MKDDRDEAIVVFKKEVNNSAALSFLKKTGTGYRKGMDSSKGKIYFYKTGPKFILTFESEEERDKFISEYRNRKEIYEIYIPDWKIQKD